MRQDDPPSCVHCKHFFVTWDEANPRGCHAYGFKCTPYPSQVVLESSGERCQLFARNEVASRKPTPKSRGPARGR